MAIKINTNLQSHIIQKSLNKSTSRLNQTIERMTTGAKINHAKDNAANYSISTNLCTKISSYEVAQENTLMGLDMLTTASDSLNNIQNKLGRLRELAIQARNGPYGKNSLDAINKEATAIVDEIERNYSQTKYNGINLFGEDSSFIKKVERRDTSSMTKLSEVNSSTIISSGEYSIGSVEELEKLATMTNSGKIQGGEFVLSDDIDLASIENWTPIGRYSRFFTGTFDGNGYVISNLTINAPEENYRGLFGAVNNAIIKNVGIKMLIL